MCSSCAQSGEQLLQFAFELPQELKHCSWPDSSFLCVFWRAQLCPSAGLSSSMILPLCSVGINPSCPKTCALEGEDCLVLLTGREAFPSRASHRLLVPTPCPHGAGLKEVDGSLWDLSTRPSG